MRPIISIYADNPALVIDYPHILLACYLLLLVIYLLYSWRAPGISVVTSRIMIAFCKKLPSCNPLDGLLPMLYNGYIQLAHVKVPCS